jgi:hypothetical protein
MKKIFSIHYALVIITFSTLGFPNLSIAQTVIPNSDFELWTGGEPDSWNTSNMMVLFTQFTTVVRENIEPYSGISSARLQTVTQNVFPLGTVSIPGILTLGELNIDYLNQTASLTGGTPFTGVPQSLKGFYKYQPTTLDSCFLGFGLFKWNNGTRDTLGYSYQTFGNTAAAWTAFQVPLEYQIWEVPDTMNIAFLSSNVLDGLPHGGTKLWVDSLSLVYGNVSIEGITFPSDFKLYADGANHLLIIDPDLGQQETVCIEVFDIAGKLLIHQSKLLQDTELTMDIDKLSTGTYIFRANITGKKPFVRKFSILN